MRCLARTKVALARCKNQTRFLVCRKHIGLPFYLLVVLVIALAADLSDIYTNILKPRFWDTRPVLVNTELVLDCSDAMALEFDQGTRLDAAREVIQKILGLEVANSDNLALRRFGGPCDGENTKMLVEFDTDNERRVLEELANITPAGEAALVEAVVEASGDFNDVERFRGMIKKIVILTTVGESCHPNPREAILARMRNMKDEDSIEISFRFIGMAVPESQRREFTAIAKASGGDAKVVFVDNKVELDEAISGILLDEVVMVAADLARQSFKAVTTFFAKAKTHMAAKERMKAQATLKKASKEFQHIDLVLDNLDERYSARFESLAEKLQEIREEQEKLLSQIAAAVAQPEQDSLASSQPDLDWLEHEKKLGEMMNNAERSLAGLVPAPIEPTPHPSEGHPKQPSGSSRPGPVRKPVRLVTSNVAFDVKTPLGDRNMLAGAKAGLISQMLNSGWARVIEVGENCSLWLTDYSIVVKGNTATVEMRLEIRTPAMFSRGDFLFGQNVRATFDISNLAGDEADLDILRGEATKQLRRVRPSSNSAALINTVFSVFEQGSARPPTPLETIEAVVVGAHLMNAIERMNSSGRFVGVMR